MAGVAEGCGVSGERRRDQGGAAVCPWEVAADFGLLAAGGAAVCPREVAAGLEEFGGEVGEFGAFAHA